MPETLNKDWLPEVAAHQASQKRYDAICGILIVALMLTGFGFIAGYAVGISETRPPTFSESVMKANEIAVLNHDRRCAMPLSSPINPMDSKVK